MGTENTHWTQLKTAALWMCAAVQLTWKALTWCIRTLLVVTVGALYIIRQAVHGTLNFLMPANRFDRMEKAVSGFVATGLDSLETNDVDDVPEVNMWNIGYDEYLRDPIAWEARWGK